ncbi:hypothetical protein TrRE_jg11570, partial [Triparma retinervis]
MHRLFPIYRNIPILRPTISLLPLPSRPLSTSRTSPPKKGVGTSPSSFLDRCFLKVVGGKGGAGAVSFESLDRGKKRPDGGNGGRGGNVYVKARKETLVSSYGRSSTVHLTASSLRLPKSSPTPLILELELKTLADVGLVGYPNAGKSSLLGALSLARPAVGSYSFTTLTPTVGRVMYGDGYRLDVADVPGIIEGASEGRG